MTDSEHPDFITPDRDPVSATPPPFRAPPTTPGALASPHHRTSWPTVISVVGIVWASLAYLSAVCGISVIFVWPYYIDMMRGTLSAADLQTTEDALPPTWWIIVSNLVGLVLTTVLMIGAVRLLRRLPSAVRFLMVWIVVNIILVPITFAANLLISQSSVSTQSSLYGTSSLIGLVLGLIMAVFLGWGLPFALLFWLRRPKIRAEIAGWHEPQDHQP